MVLNLVVSLTWWLGFWCWWLSVKKYIKICFTICFSHSYLCNYIHILVWCLVGRCVQSGDILQWFLWINFFSLNKLNLGNSLYMDCFPCSLCPSLTVISRTLGISQNIAVSFTQPLSLSLSKLIRLKHVSLHIYHSISQSSINVLVGILPGS